MDMQSAEELRNWVLTGLGAIGAAAALRSKLSKDKSARALDQLTVTQNESTSSWIEKVVRERDEAVTRERQTFETLQILHIEIKELSLKQLMCEEQIARLKNRNRRLEQIVVQTRPELEGWLTTEPGEMSEAPEIQIRPEKPSRKR